MELKSIIKNLRSKLTPKIYSEQVLEEDSDSLRRSLLHVEGINDRLHYDIAKNKETQERLQHQIKNLQNEN